MEHLALVDPALRQQFEASKKSEVKWTDNLKDNMVNK
jgi:hypothetical protein